MRFGKFRVSINHMLSGHIVGILKALEFSPWKISPDARGFFWFVGESPHFNESKPGDRIAEYRPTNVPGPDMMVHADTEDRRSPHRRGYRPATVGKVVGLLAQDRVPDVPDAND